MGQTGANGTVNSGAAGLPAMEARDLPAARESDMFQRKISRAGSAGLLAAALLVAGSAPANAAGRSPKGLWRWMMEEWQEWTGVLVPQRPAETPGSGNGSWIKEGPGIDPNGGTAPKPGGSTGSACRGCGDSESGTGPGGGR